MTRSVFAMTRPVREQRKRALLKKLREPPARPLTAIVLAKACQILGSRETRRRAVRKLVEMLREDGHCVCAGKGFDGEGTGYWLARDYGEWDRYRKARRSAAIFEFVTLRKMTEAARERSGRQGKLFETAPLGY